MTEPVQPIVNEAHLRLLIDERSESDIVDYKRELDLRGPGKGRALVELTKDVGAMSSGRAGYIGVGLDGHGHPTGLLMEQQAQVLDEADLRSKLKKYLPTGIDIRSAVHESDGHFVALIYAGPDPDGLVISKADGNYTDEKGKLVTVHRAGEVFVRHGTKSQRWTREDAQRWIRDTQRAAEQRGSGRGHRRFAKLSDFGLDEHGVERRVPASVWLMIIERVLRSAGWRFGIATG